MVIINLLFNPTTQMDNLLRGCRSTIILIKSIAMLHHSCHISGIDKLKDLLVQYFQFKLKAIEMGKNNTAGEVISETFHKDLCTCLDELVELVNDVLIKQGTESNLNLLLFYSFMHFYSCHSIGGMYVCVSFIFNFNLCPLCNFQNVSSSEVLIAPRRYVH